MPKPKRHISAKSSKSAKQQDEELRKLLNKPLPFSGRGFFKLCIVALDIAYCLMVPGETWNYVVMELGHSRAYFVTVAYMQIAIAQLFFAALYHAGLFLSRYITRK
jgi:hypothetical protein